MKKVFVLLGVLCALCFLACSNFQLAGGEAGVVSLAIGDDLASEIRSAASSRSIASGISYTVTGVLSGEYSAESSVTVDSGALAGATLSFENVPVGTTVTLNLSVQAGTNLVWIGNSETHVVTAGENSLDIALGRVSGVLMWSGSSTSSESGTSVNLEIKISPLGNYETSSINLSGPGTSLAWTFDKKGNIYLYTDVGETIAQRYDVQPDGSYNASGVFYEAPPFYAFAHDSTTDSLYGIVDGGSVKYWSNEGGEGKIINEQDGNPLSGGDVFGFVVHNDIVYIATCGEFQGEGDDAPILGTVQLVSFKLENSGDSKVAARLAVGDEFTLPEAFGSNPPMSQMIYHEGSLYLLLSNVSIGGMEENLEGDKLAENYSLGAVLKINPDTLALDTSFGSGGYLGLADTHTEITGIDETSYGMTGGSVVYHGPTPNTESNVFYGPMGFVAVMPKKLVIADAGFTMSKSSTSENKVQFTKKTNIITIDLETCTFDKESVDDKYYHQSYAEIAGSSSGYEYFDSDIS